MNGIKCWLEETKNEVKPKKVVIIKTSGVKSPEAILDAVEASLNGQNVAFSVSSMLQKFKISRTINERITHSIKLLRNLSKENNLVLLLDDLEDFQSSETINSFLKEIILMGINNELRPVIVSSSTSRSNELYALVKKPQFYRVEIDELLINEAKEYIFTNIGKSITDDDLKKIPFPKMFHFYVRYVLF